MKNKANKILSLLLAIAMLVTFCLPVMAADGVMKETGVFELNAYNAQGNLIWTEDIKNDIANEGQYMFLDVTLRNGTAPAGYYIRLYNTTPTKTSTLSGLTGEPSTNGYAAQAVARNSTGWPTLALDTGDYQGQTLTTTFNATGGSWGPVTYAVLATTSDNTGKLVSFAALSQSRTLASGESLQVTYKLKLQ